MKILKNLKYEDLEVMSYSDIAELILKENGKEKSTADLFRKICDLLKLPEKTFENKIGDFYTALTTDKRFILLETGNWDLKENHSVAKLKLDDEFNDLEEDEEIEDTPNSDVEEEYEDEDKDIYDDSREEDDDDITDEYKDLVIVDEEDLEEQS